MRFRFGYTYENTWNSLLDYQSEWESPVVANEDEARALFREDHGAANYTIEYVIEMKETRA